MSRLARLLRDRRSITVLDQVVSSASNFLPGLFAAKVLSTTDFGIFALVQVVYILALGIGRAAFGEVAMLSDAGRSARLAAVDSTAIASLLLGVPAVAVLLAVVHAPAGSVVAAVAGVIVMLVQDPLRLGAISAGRPSNALLNDSLWLVATLAGLTLVAVDVLPRNPWVLTAVWGLGAVFGAVAGALFLGWRGPRANRAAAFVVGHRRQSGSFLGDWAIKTGAVQVATYGVGLLGGIATVAGIRAAQLLLGPLNILFSGIALTLMPRAVELRHSRVAELPRVMRKASLVLGGASTALGLLLTVIPVGLLRVVVGEQAEGLTRYALPLALSLAASGLITGSNIGLRALSAGRRLLAARTVTAAFTLVGGAIGFTASHSALGSLWGLALGALVGVPVWEVLLARAVRAPAILA